MQYEDSTNKGKRLTSSQDDGDLPQVECLALSYVTWMRKMRRLPYLLRLPQALELKEALL